MLRIHRYAFLLAILALIISSCTFTEPTKPPLGQPLIVELYTGPAEGEVVPIGAFVTFSWKARGGAGGYSYTYQLSGIDPSPITTDDQHATYRDLLTSGSYTFTVTVIDQKGASAQTARNFTVGANTLPQVTITGPRPNPKYAPGADVHLSWTTKDPDLFGKITACRWAKTEADANADNYSAWAQMSAVTFVAPTTVGSYKFYLQVKDNAGGVTTTTFDYSVTEPTILWVDETSDWFGYHGGEAPLTFLQEWDWDKWYKTMLDGFAYEEWDVAEKGYPDSTTIPTSIRTLVWDGADPYHGSWGWNVGWAYTYWRVTGKDAYGTTNVLTYILDKPDGHAWIIGENWLEEISIWGPVYVDSTSLESEYLHLAIDSTCADAASAMYYAKAVEGLDPERYPTMAVDIAKGTGSVQPGANMLYLGAGAEAVYEAYDLNDVLQGICAYRWPAHSIGGPGLTKLFLQTFEPYLTAIDVSQKLAQTVLGYEFGE